MADQPLAPVHVTDTTNRQDSTQNSASKRRKKKINITPKKKNKPPSHTKNRTHLATKKIAQIFHQQAPPETKTVAAGTCR